MAVGAKICGLNDAGGVTAAVEHGARAVGFVFYERSPRAVPLDVVRRLAAGVPAGVLRVGVFVDPDDESIGAAIEAAGLNVVQLHGRETPARAEAVRERFGVEVMKAIRIAGPDDLEPVAAFARVCDHILFDAKPPDDPALLPGGNGLRFDWRLLEGLDLPVPWFLSGGVDADNLVEAVRLTGAAFVDVSSGVEVRPGLKDTALIKRFLETAARIEPVVR